MKDGKLRLQKILRWNKVAKQIRNGNGISKIVTVVSFT